MQNINILVTFTIPDAFVKSGTYTISFEYLFKHEETDIIDTNKLKSIAGESAPIEAEIIPEDIGVYDYSFSVEFIGQETVEETDIAILRTTMGADISEYIMLRERNRKFVLTGKTTWFLLPKKGL